MWRDSQKTVPFVVDLADRIDDEISKHLNVDPGAFAAVLLVLGLALIVARNKWDQVLAKRERDALRELSRSSTTTNLHDD